jgi:thiol-disulfide isomerase/thioredoxin
MSNAELCHQNEGLAADELGFATCYNTTMKRVWIVIVSIVAVIALAMIYLIVNSRPASSPHNASTVGNAPTAEPKEHPQAEPQPATKTPGSYADYSQEVIAKTKGRKILFFHAPWCPQCRALEQSITSNTIPPDLTIFKVDYDSSTALRQKYGVAIQTTLVEVDGTGTMLQKYVAYDEPSLAAVIKGMKLD